MRRPEALATPQEASPASPLTPPARHDPLFLLARHLLEVGGERFPLSAPRPVGEGPLGTRCFLGLAMRDARRVLEWEGQTATLWDTSRDVRVPVRLVQVDPVLATLLVEHLPAR